MSTVAAFTGAREIASPTNAPATEWDLSWITRVQKAKHRALFAMGRGSLERLQKAGAIFLICDFALGHLAGRLATKAGAEKEAVLAELRTTLVPGAILVPSGIFGAAQAQNAGCAFIPA